MGVNLDLLDVSHNNGYLHVERELDTRRCAYRLTLQGMPPTGSFYDTLEFRVLDSREIVRVPVSARVLDRVSVIPANVFLRRKHKSGDYEPLSILFTSSSTDIDLSRIRLANETNFEIDRVESLDKRRYRVQLSATREIAESPTEVQFVVSDMEKVTVRVFASNPPPL